MSVDLTVLTTDGDAELDEKDPEFSHIVGPIYTDEGKIQGAARITEAIINGTPIEALCGFMWVPSKDPNRYPLCPRCKAIFERQGT